MSSFAGLPDIIIAVAGGGVLGSVVTKLIDVFTGRAGRKATAKKDDSEAAKALTSATVEFTKAVTEMNRVLNGEVENLKRAIIALTDAVDAIIPTMSGLTDFQKRALIDANNAAKLAL